MTENRKTWIDVARCFAILCVVLCHCVEKIYALKLEFVSTLSLKSKLFAFTTFTCGRLGVPIFLFITGYLLLDRTYHNQDIKLFWKKNLVGLALTTGIWIILYDFFLCWYNQSTFDLSVLIRNLLYTESVGLSHMWYMPVILGTYLFLPFVSISLHHVDTKLLKIPVSVSFVYLFVIPTVNVICETYGWQTYQSLLGVGFSGGVYGLYIVFGYLIRKGILKPIKKIYLLFAGSVAFLCTVAIQIRAFDRDYKYCVWYTNALLFICALIIFELLSRIPFSAHRIVANLSKCSFGIYLIHNPIIMMFLKFIEFRGILPIKVIWLYILAFLSSWLIVNLVGKNQKIGKILFYMK
jgi:surface polysaccharide O-acyltransferase-like enzyme